MAVETRRNEVNCSVKKAVDLSQEFNGTGVFKRDWMINYTLIISLRMYLPFALHNML